MILLDDDADERFRRLVLFEESLLDDAAARLARIRPDAQRHDEERRRDDVAAERGDLAYRGHDVTITDPGGVPRTTQE